MSTREQRYFQKVLSYQENEKCKCYLNKNINKIRQIVNTEENKTLKKVIDLSTTKSGETGKKDKARLFF